MKGESAALGDGGTVRLLPETIGTIVAGVVANSSVNKEGDFGSSAGRGELRFV